MSKVFKIGIAENNNQQVKEVKLIKVIAGKGVVDDRHFHDTNNPYNQLSLIESENIDYYNKKYNLNIPYLNFRRNIITKGIKLNDLVDKKLLIGDTQVLGIDLCRPCKHLEDILKQNNIITEFLRKGGLRCEILSSSKIFIDDEIKII